MASFRQIVYNYEFLLAKAQNRGKEQKVKNSKANSKTARALQVRWELRLRHINGI